MMYPLLIGLVFAGVTVAETHVKYHRTVSRTGRR